MKMLADFINIIKKSRKIIFRVLLFLLFFSVCIAFSLVYNRIANGGLANKGTQYDVTGTKAYYIECTNNSLQILVENISELDITLLDIVDEDGRQIAVFDKDTIIYTQLTHGVNDYYFELPLLVESETVLRSDLMLQYQYDKSSKVYITSIGGWAPHNYDVYNETQIRTQDNTDSFSFINIVDNRVTFEGQKIVLDRNLFIPKGMTLNISQGQEIIFNNSAVIFCRDSIFVEGTEENPVKFYSTDNTGNGIVIMNTTTRSKINWLEVDGLNEINVGAYHLTGRVTFYQADVDITNSIFRDSNSEDSLNIVKSDCYVSNTIFDTSYQDAFDSDFSTGIFENCTFINAGNDAFDVSGSVFTLRNCKFENTHDKAISVGERSTVIIENVTIDGAQIGLGAKDSSKVTGSNLTISNATIAFCMYQKKPEYGTSDVSVADAKFDVNNQYDYIIESEESLVVNDQKLISRDSEKEAQIIYSIINEVPFQ